MLNMSSMVCNIVIILVLHNAVSDNMVCQFITTPPVSKYFSDLADSLNQQCIHLDNLVFASEYVNFLEMIISVEQSYFINCQ